MYIWDEKATLLAHCWQDVSDELKIKVGDNFRFLLSGRMLSLEIYRTWILGSCDDGHFFFKHGYLLFVVSSRFILETFIFYYLLGQKIACVWFCLELTYKLFILKPTSLCFERFISLETHIKWFGIFFRKLF